MSHVTLLNVNLKSWNLIYQHGVGRSYSKTLLHKKNPS